MSVQSRAETSQKFTWPAVIVPDAGVTVALSVTIVPDATVVTGPELDDTARAVVVTSLLCAGAARFATRSRPMVKPIEGMFLQLIDENQDRTRKITA